MEATLEAIADWWREKTDQGACRGCGGDVELAHVAYSIHYEGMRGCVGSGQVVWIDTPVCGRCERGQMQGGVYPCGLSDAEAGAGGGGIDGGGAEAEGEEEMRDQMVVMAIVAGIVGIFGILGGLWVWIRGVQWWGDREWRRRCAETGSTYRPASEDPKV